MRNICWILINYNLGYRSHHLQMTGILILLESSLWTGKDLSYFFLWPVPNQLFWAKKRIKFLCVEQTWVPIYSFLSTACKLDFIYKSKLWSRKDLLFLLWELVNGKFYFFKGNLKLFTGFSHYNHKYKILIIYGWLLSSDFFHCCEDPMIGHREDSLCKAEGTHLYSIYI